jgi:hypothetical protein
MALKMTLSSSESPLAHGIAGLLGHGQAQLDYLMYLFMQAVVVFVWWPKNSLREVLTAGNAPDTLLAAVIAAGFASAWFSARAGAQELLAPRQRGLHDWAAHTPVAPARLLGADLAAQVLHTLHLLALSAPLLLMAFAVSGGDPGALAWCVCAIVFQALFYRLAAACVCLFIGPQRAMTTVLVRAIVIAGYLLTALFVPAASHLVLAWRLLDQAPQVPHAEAALLFMLVYGALAALLAVLLIARIARLRRDGTPAEAAA